MNRYLKENVIFKKVVLRERGGFEHVEHSNLISQLISQSFF